jgi:hypothetical protein
MVQIQDANRQEAATLTWEGETPITLEMKERKRAKGALSCSDVFGFPNPRFLNVWY